jgi:histidyl-tRNA synthetase
MATRFQVLPGFRDFYPDECAARNYVFEVWRQVSRRYGFVEYEGPMLEPTELYTRKSGAEIVNQLFCFTDKGERDVSLRPELTPTLARMAAARQRDFRKPMRWFSIGQFFRYERHQKGRGREFYQFNCDLLGETAASADAELIALAIDLMRQLGFTAEHFRLRVSDRNVWVNFAESKGLTGDGISQFLQIIDKMERTPEEKTRELLDALGITLEAVRELISGGADVSPVLAELVKNLQQRGLGDFVEIDLGIVRGLAYYTGIVFEIFDIGQGMRAIAGGGRYDQLVGLIGGVDLPACGFAMGDMVITDLIRATPGPCRLLEEAISFNEAVDVWVVLADETKQGEALALAQTLRNAGLRVVFSLTPAKVAKQFQQAESSGAITAVVVGSEFPDLTVKDLARRSESRCTDSSLVELLRNLLGKS